MGDASTLKPDLCQVWSVGLEGLDMRSSRSRHAATQHGRGTFSGTVPSAAVASSVTMGSSLLRNASQVSYSSPDDLTVEVSVP